MDHFHYNKMEGIIKLSEGELRSAPGLRTLATGTTIASTTQGSAMTVRGLQPVQFLKDVVDGAKNQLFFANFCGVVNLPSGTHQVSIPKRKKYLGRSGVTYDTSEPTNADMSVTQIDNMDSVHVTPTVKYSGVAISNFNLRVNVLNLVQWAKDDLSYAIGDKVDREIATTIGDATLTTSSAAGAQTLYGGNANADSALTLGDTLTTDLIAKGARYIKQTQAFYWTGGVETLSADTKNPWLPTNQEPFVLFIAPAQEEVLRKDSQFVNAAEYGSDRVIQNGEIGEYLGIKIVVTNNVEIVASGGTAPDGGSVTGTNMTRCIMMKAKVSCKIVWGQKPTLKVFDYPQRDQTWITLISAYLPSVVQNDSIVFIDASDV